MARELAFAIPGDLNSRTGGYLYDKRLIAELTRLGWQVRHLALPARFPFPDEADRGEARRIVGDCAGGALVMIDGLALGALPELAEAEAGRLRLVALVHHPLALETGLGATDRNRFALSERRALVPMRAVIVTSRATARALVADYGVPDEKIAVVEPGCEISPEPPRRQDSGAVCLLAVGSVTPRKGFDVLVEALARITDLPWRLTVAGSLERAPDCAAALRQAIADHGFEGRIDLVGEAANCDPLYREADIFVLASRHEGYGMVFAEALAHGLPIVGTAAGAIPDLVPPEAGLLVSPDDPAALAEALAALVADPSRRAALAAGAAEAGARLPRWTDTAEIVSRTLSAIG